MVVAVDKTLGDAWLAGLAPQARCLRGRRSGPVKIEPCGYVAGLDLQTLIWTRGARFPLWKLESRLKCPRCGGVRVVVEWLPLASPGARAAADLLQCEAARDAARAR